MDPIQPWISFVVCALFVGFASSLKKVLCFLLFCCFVQKSLGDSTNTNWWLHVRSQGLSTTVCEHVPFSGEREKKKPPDLWS